jgi:predicted RNase H-like HicB family nuclease
MSNIIPIRFRAVVRQDPETGAHVSHVAALRLYSAGRSPEEAFKAAESAVQLYLDVAAEKGTLGQCLLETGVLNTGKTIAFDASSYQRSGVRHRYSASTRMRTHLINHAH